MVELAKQHIARTSKHQLGKCGSYFVNDSWLPTVDNLRNLLFDPHGRNVQFLATLAGSVSDDEQAQDERYAT